MKNEKVTISGRGRSTSKNLSFECLFNIFHLTYFPHETETLMYVTKTEKKM